MKKLELNFKPCRFCMNARVQPPVKYDEDGYSINGEQKLTDENDFSSVSVGSAAEGYRLSINSGYGTPVNISFQSWDEKSLKNVVKGSYFPKFCPECGRPLAEYDSDWVKYGLQNMPYEMRYWLKAKGLLGLEPKYFSSLMTIFETWQPNDAFYDKAIETACLNYAEGAYRVLVCAEGIGIQRDNAYLIASFKHSELDDCLRFLEGVFSVLKDRTGSSEEPAGNAAQASLTSFFTSGK